MLELSSYPELKSHGSPVVTLPYGHRTDGSGDFLLYEPPKKMIIIGYLSDDKKSNSGSRQNGVQAEKFVAIHY